MRAAILINPRAGLQQDDTVANRTALARSTLQKFGISGQVTVTEGRNHGREVARLLVESGIDTVVVWGGDGTVNAVASQLAFHDAALGIVPAGSGNGLARELGLDWDPERALDVALRGPVQFIDAGELGGHLFFNVAGVGFDAHLATVFNAGTHRGILGYLRAMVRELMTYEPVRYEVKSDDFLIRDRAMIVAIANTRQYGNRAIIAPLARPDDGLLALVVVPPLSPLSGLWQACRLFTGTVHRLQGVAMRSVCSGEITGSGPLTFHVDGEVVSGARELSFNVHPGALGVRVPIGDR